MTNNQQDQESFELRTCAQCGADYILGENQLKWFVETFGSAGVPKRCGKCRAARRQQRVEVAR
jgi:Probable zinc-ribbon domain